MAEDEEERQEPEGAEWPTERVRIVGAEPAAVLAERPAEPAPPGDADPTQLEEHYLGFVHQPSPPPPPMPPPPLPGGELAPGAPELPHWTDPPTGQVPAVIDRRSEDSEDTSWSSVGDSGPVWREHEHEWESGGFEPAMLADDESPMGALDESAPGERRPWDFDDLVSGAGDQDLGSLGLEATAAAEPGGAGSSSPASEEGGGRRVLPWGKRPTDFLSEVGDPFGEADADSGPGLFATVAESPEDNGSASWWDGEPEPAPRWAQDQPAPGGERSEPSVTDRLTEPARTLAVPAVAVRSAAQHAEGGSAAAPAAARSARGTRPPRTRGGEGGQGGGRNVPVAVVTGLVVAGVVLGCFALGPMATVVLATVGVTLAAAETYASFRRAGMHPATLLGLVATVGVMIAAYDKGVAALPLVAALLVVTSMIWYLVGADRGAPVVGISSTVLGFAWVGILGSFAALILAPSIYPHRHGVAFALGAVVATVGADVGALAVGSWLGRHQLAPHVSPNKTWEGWLGGAVLAVVASVFITGHVHPWTPAKAGILGVVVAVVAPLGDLCESLVKRDLGLKDMGSLLPGHGGVLDRMDALLFVLPATYYLVRVMHLG